MKKILILLVLVIFLTGCVTFPVKEAISFPKFGAAKKQIAVGRGVRMSFTQNMPPREIRGPFRVALEFTNNNPNPVSGTLSIRDISVYEGFEPQTRNVVIPGAIVDYADQPDPQTGEFIIKSAKPSRLPVDFGRIEYKEAEAGAITQFLADFDFNYIANLDTRFCVGRAEARGPRCPETEVFSGQQLGFENRFSPVSASVRKTAPSSTPGEVLVDLEITLNNVGGGEIPEDQFLIAQVETIGEGLELECYSPQSEDPSGTTFEIQMENNKATINCFGDAFFAPDIVVHNLFITLSYPYRLSTNTGKISIIPRPQQTL